MYWLKQTFPVVPLTRKNLLLILIATLLYIIFARISQVFAIDPGNITPVWIPSGLMLAMALRYGSRIWPGVFLGAYLGNVWAYISFDSVSAVFRALAAGLFNGFGDVIAVVLMALIIKHLTKHSSPFNSLREFLIFGIAGAIIGPLISALFGVTSLQLLGVVPPENYFLYLTTWWIGDGVGVLLVTPLILSFLDSEKQNSTYFFPSLIFGVGVFSTFTGILFSLIEPCAWLIALCVLLVPIAFVVMLYVGQRMVFIVQVFISSIAIIATYLGKGPFDIFQPMAPLTSLQLFIGMFSCVLFALAVVVNKQQSMTEKLKTQRQKLEGLYRRDALTGLWNRYRIEEFLDHEVKKLDRGGPRFAVFLIDIDSFKSINDSFGHLKGDQVLKQMSQLINQQIRDSDLFGRWGGEEFIIVAPEANIADAKSLANKLVKLVADNDFSLERKITISIGLSMSQSTDTSASILQRADDALYKAKNDGKNQFSTM